MRRLRSALLLVLLALLLSGGALAEDITIHEYRAQCTIDMEGKAKMTVSVDLTLPSPMQTLDFPIGQGTDGVVSGMESERIETEDGHALRLRNESGFSGRHTYVFGYDLGQVIEDTEDGQQLSTDLIAPGWQWAMETASFTVTLPSSFDGAPVYAGGYHGDLAEDYWTLSQSGTELTGVSTESLLDHDSLRLTLDLPADYVQIGRDFSETASLIAVLILALLCALYWLFTLYMPPPNVRLRPQPPDGVGAGDLPLLHSCAEPSLPLQIAGWAARGYVYLHTDKQGRTILHQLQPADPRWRKLEREAFDKLFFRRAVCEVDGARFTAVAERFRAQSGAWWRQRLYQRSSGLPVLLEGAASLAMGLALFTTASCLPLSGAPYILILILAVPLGIAAGLGIQEGLTAYVRRRWALAICAGALALVLLVLAIVLGGTWTMLLSLGLQLLASGACLRGGRRTRFGQASLAEVLGFHRYLSHIDQRQLVHLLHGDGQYFYRMLPYAEAIGLGRELCRRLGEVEMPPCTWYRYGTKRRQTASEFYARFQSLLRKMGHHTL